MNLPKSWNVLLFSDRSARRSCIGGSQVRQAQIPAIFISGDIYSARNIISHYYCRINRFSRRVYEKTYTKRVNFFFVSTRKDFYFSSSINVVFEKKKNQPNQITTNDGSFTNFVWNPTRHISSAFPSCTYEKTIY